jgi:hypothetical protein
LKTPRREDRRANKLKQKFVKMGWDWRLFIHGSKLHGGDGKEGRRSFGDVSYRSSTFAQKLGLYR